MSPVPVACFEVKHHSPQVIYALVKDYQDLSDEPLEIDPEDGEFRFLPVLYSIIENPNTPTEVREAACAMYDSEFIRHF